jgi:hypothetical protein
MSYSRTRDKGEMENKKKPKLALPDEIPEYADGVHTTCP